MKLQLPAEAGTLFLKALDAALLDVPLPSDEQMRGNARERTHAGADDRMQIDDQDNLHNSRGTSEARKPNLNGQAPSWAARRADALVVLANQPDTETKA